VVEAHMERFIEGLRFHPEIARSLTAVLLDRYQERQGEILKAAAHVGHNVADLEAQKAQIVHAFKLATSDVMRRGLENDADELEKRIEAAKIERTLLEITEENIEAFTADASGIMEHPAILLKDPINIRQQQMLYSLVFDELPTYEEIVDGTPKLSWIFYCSSESTTRESALVHVRGLDWNIIETTILRWKELCALYNLRALW
jgi:hypothetical protein